MRPDEISAAIRAKFPQVKEEAGTNYIIVPKESILEVSEYIKNPPLSFDNLHCITGIDRKDEKESNRKGESESEFDFLGLGGLFKGTKIRS